MQPIWSLDIPGVIDQIETFLIKDETIKTFVVYTYYDEHEQPLYIGCSKAFYDAHYFNSERLSFFNDVKYVSWAFFNSEDEMKEAKKIFVRTREPKHNSAKYKRVSIMNDLDVVHKELVVLREDIDRTWDDFFDSWETINNKQ